MTHTLRKWVSLLTCLTLIFLLGLPALAADADIIYVGPSTSSGSDSNAGTDPAAPVATVERALALVKEGGTISFVGNISQQTHTTLSKGVTFTSHNDQRRDWNMRGSLTLGGNTTFDNINLAFLATGGDDSFRSIYANGYNATFSGKFSAVAAAGDTTRIPVLYAGAESGNVDRSPVVDVQNGVFHSVYGGGKNGSVAGATIKISGSETKLTGGLYGGSRSGTSAGDVSIQLSSLSTAALSGGFYPNHGTTGAVDLSVTSASLQPTTTFQIRNLTLSYTDLLLTSKLTLTGSLTGNSGILTAAGVEVGTTMSGSGGFTIRLSNNVPLVVKDKITGDFNVAQAGGNVPQENLVQTGVSSPEANITLVAAPGPYSDINYVQLGKNADSTRWNVTAKPRPGVQVKYVNGTTGNDESGDGTEAKPYATVTKAVSVMPDADNGDIIITGDTTDADVSLNVKKVNVLGQGNPKPKWKITGTLRVNTSSVGNNPSTKGSSYIDNLELNVGKIIMPSSSVNVRFGSGISMAAGNKPNMDTYHFSPVTLQGGTYGKISYVDTYLYDTFYSDLPGGTVSISNSAVDEVYKVGNLELLTDTVKTINWIRNLYLSFGTTWETATQLKDLTTWNANIQTKKKNGVMNVVLKNDRYASIENPTSLLGDSTSGTAISVEGGGLWIKANTELQRFTPLQRKNNAASAVVRVNSGSVLTLHNGFTYIEYDTDCSVRESMILEPYNPADTSALPPEGVYARIGQDYNYMNHFVLPAGMPGKLTTATKDGYVEYRYEHPVVEPLVWGYDATGKSVSATVDVQALKPDTEGLLILAAYDNAGALVSSAFQTADSNTKPTISLSTDTAPAKICAYLVDTRYNRLGAAAKDTPAT